MTTERAAALRAAAAREGLEAVIRRVATTLDGDGRPRSLLGEGAIRAVLAAADAYRDAAPDDDGRVVHLEGLEGDHTACRRRWKDPELLKVTGNPAAVNCPRCRRSLRYRAMTGGCGDG